MNAVQTSPTTNANRPNTSTPDSSASKTGAVNSAAGTKSAISSDFETFLTMLTAQIQNQDPLNPVDSTDFATQLATFSSVEQQVLTNDLLTGLGAQMGALSVSQLASWVGMEARALMPAVFDGSPIRIETEASVLANKAQMVVKDSLGVEVQRIDIATTRTEFDWAGVDANGRPLPSGTYEIAVESFSNGQLIDTQAATLKGRIIEARNEHGKPVLVMNNGLEVESSNILGLSNPA